MARYFIVVGRTEVATNRPAPAIFDFGIVKLGIDASPGFTPDLLLEENFDDETHITFKDRMGYAMKQEQWH